MALATLHRDRIPSALPPLVDLSVARESDAAVMAALQKREVAEMERRFAQGHRAYVARWDGRPTGWGWVATVRAEIGELVGVGRQIRRLDVRLVGKQVWQLGGDGFDAFDSFYAGISVAVRRP